MPDGEGFPPIQLATIEASLERRGPMRPARMTSARARMSGRLLARGFMAADGLFLLGAALGLQAAGTGARPETLIAAVLTMALLFGVGAYDLRPRTAISSHLVMVAATAAGGLVTPLFVGGVLQARASASADLAWAAVVAAALSGLHLAWFLIVARLRARGQLTPNVVIVGATPAAERLIRWAMDSHGAVNVIGVFDDRRGRTGPTIAGVPILGGTADLVEHKILPYVDRIIITVPAKARSRIRQLTDLMGAIPNPITLLLDSAEAKDERASMARIANFSLRQISGGAPSGAGHMAKRALDLAASCTAVVLLSPVLLGVALAIRLDSPGPVLFRQKRFGYLNEEFLVFKFRSMRVEATDAQARRQVSANDDRVTRVGRFIRKTSLDELPQLFNVISGEMSLVGPRPHAIGMLVGGEEAHRLLTTYAHRHRIKPGLTGWAAIHGSRGPVDTPEEVQRRVALDLEYIERQSFWLDLRIMLQTLPCLLGDKSAVR